MPNYSNALANNFSVVIQALPNTEFFLTTTTIPIFNLEPLVVDGLAGQFNAHGDKIQFQTLSTDFIIDAAYGNYEEIFTWIFSNSNPRNMEISEIPETDIHVLALDNNKQPIARWRFVDAFPVSLGGPQLDTGSEAQHLTSTVEWAYTYMIFERINGTASFDADLPTI